MLKDYSFRLKKNIVVLLHIIFVTLIIVGLSMIYENVPSKRGALSAFGQEYEDSDQFLEQFQTDLDHVFRYVSYRDVFETNGYVDLSKEMFSINRGNSTDIIYNLDEVLRYAKSQGFYLDQNYEVKNDMPGYENALMDQNCNINWKAYSTDYETGGPGERTSSLMELSREVMNCLGEYYTVYYRMIDKPSNFRFRIVYADDIHDPDEELTQVYTNCEDIGKEEILESGKYCYTDSESAVVDSNLSELPKNIIVSMENNNLYDSMFYVAASVNTDFPVDDIYLEQYNKFQKKKELCREGLMAFLIGLTGAAATLWYLFSVSGHRRSREEEPELRYFDTISTESCIVLTGAVALFLVFLAEKMSDRLIQLIVPELSRNFVQWLLNSVIVYACALIGIFSLVRRYKARVLWKNSMLYRLKEDFSEYFAEGSFSKRMLYFYLGFLAVNGVGVCCIAGAIFFRHHPAAKAVFAAASAVLVIAEYKTWKAMFSVTKQEDRIADAIRTIAGGDTSYQMPLDGLYGKEKAIAENINFIGTGLERAIQEQFKSERLKADLITNVSHDIKTPLTSIINYVDLIKREHIPNEKLQEYIRVLEQKSQRLKTLTEDLVEASKASSGNLKMNMTKLDLVEMIWQTNGEFEEKYETRRLKLMSALPETGMMIEADGRHLWRVLENLYNNAYKYAMEGSRVYTEVTGEDGMAYFTIKNVSEKSLNVNPDELTERFVRGDVSRTTEGSGLGLSIAQSLTKLQGGTFEIIIDGDLFKARVGFPLV